MSSLQNDNLYRQFIKSIERVDTSIYEAVGKLNNFVNKQPKHQKLIINYFFYCIHQIILIVYHSIFLLFYNIYITTFIIIFFFLMHIITYFINILKLYSII